jgi:putative transposase
VFPTLRLTIASQRRTRPDLFRIAHYSVQGSHLHLLVEAENRAALSSGLRSLVVRIALQVNRLLMRRGSFWADRWHGRALTSPRSVRRALVYVLANFRKHQPDSRVPLDPCSSALYFDGYRDLARAPPGDSAAPGSTAHARNSPPVSPPRTWLLARGWKRHGLIATSERPAAKSPDQHR